MVWQGTGRQGAVCGSVRDLRIWPTPGQERTGTTPFILREVAGPGKRRWQHKPCALARGFLNPLLARRACVFSYPALATQAPRASKGIPRGPEGERSNLRGMRTTEYLGLVCASR